MYVFQEIEWKECREICNLLYNNNRFLTPYQSFSFLDVVGLGRIETHPFSGIGYKEKTFILYDSDLPLAVVPLFVNVKKKKIVLRGEFSIIAHLDIIYSSDITLDAYRTIIRELKSFYEGFCLKLNRISEKSLTYKYLSQMGELHEAEQSVCVSISLANGYDRWFSSLSKSFRQDIRSGYNRLQTDQKEFRFEFDMFLVPEKAAWNSMLRLYSKRACEHSDLNSKLIENGLYFLKKSNPFNKALSERNDYIGGRIYIDNKLTAYCQGVLSNDGRAIIPKLSIDLAHKRYNLGGLLINEMVIKITESKELIKISELDLSRGDEKYKYNYGGCNHYNYEWKLQL